MSLITRNAKEYRSMNAQLMSQNLPTVNPLLSPPGGLIFPSTFDGGLNREGGLKRERGGAYLI